MASRGRGSPRDPTHPVLRLAPRTPSAGTDPPNRGTVTWAHVSVTQGIRKRCYRPFVLPTLVATQQPLAARSQPVVTPSNLLAPSLGEWLSYGRTYDNLRFSPLSHITTRNVQQLAPVAVYQMNVHRADGLEATPIVAGGVMY